MITISSKGKFQSTRRFFKKMSKFEIRRKLGHYGRLGVDALASATPKDTGLTANSWEYEIEEEDGSCSIRWYNTNVVRGINIAIILQYGHGTGTGGYVVGRDYINPAIQPIFDEMAETIWKEVVSS